VRPQPVLPVGLALRPFRLVLLPGLLPRVPVLLRFPTLPGAWVPRVTEPERVLRDVPQQQQEGPSGPPAILPALLLRRVQVHAGPAHHVGLRHPNAQAQVRQGEHDPVRATGRRSHQRREGGTADRHHVEEGEPGVAEKVLVVRRFGLHLGLTATGVGSQRHLVGGERQAEPATARPGSRWPT
jgi:hypothetical protein